MRSTIKYSENILQQRYCFYHRCQQSTESLSEFVEDVIKLSTSCEFQDNCNTLIRDRVVFGLHDLLLKTKIIDYGGNPSLEETLDLCNALLMGKYDGEHISETTKQT